MSRTRRAAIYVRISQDRVGAGLGVDRQRKDCEALAAKLGWSIVAVHTDNDMSAYSGKARPGYRHLLDDIEAGRVDAVLVWHTDRLHRSPRELEAFIDLCEKHHVITETVQAGSLDLATPSGRMVARLLGAAARFEVEHKSERTRRAQLQAAEAGKYIGGARPFGWRVDAGSPRINAAEARTVRKACDALLAGASLGGIVADLNNRGIFTTTGRQWTYASLRQMLVRPRNAGHVEYAGEILARDAWPALVAEETWQAVKALLEDPVRRRSSSNRVRWLLSGIALCGECGAPLKSASVNSNRATGTTRTVYRCHVARSAEQLDAFVAALVVGRLSHPDARDLLTDDQAPDAAELRTQAMGIRQRIDGLATLYSEGAITLTALRRESDRLRAELTIVEATQGKTASSSVLAQLIGTDDVAAVWEGLDISRRRAIVDVLLQITVMPSGRRGNRFDPDLIDVQWKADV